MTKIFCDIADINLIRKFNKKILLKALQLIQALMRKAGAKDYKNIQKKFLKFVQINQFHVKYLLIIQTDMIARSKD